MIVRNSDFRERLSEECKDSKDVSMDEESNAE